MRRFIKSIAFAFNGIRLTFKSERNFKIQSIALVPTVAMGIYLGISAMEWGLVVLSIGFVLSAELFNTAIERLGDEVANNDRKLSIRNLKDISAGASLLSALTAFVIGVIILFIPFVRRMLELLQN